MDTKVATTRRAEASNQPATGPDGLNPSVTIRPNNNTTNEAITNRRAEASNPPGDARIELAQPNNSTMNATVMTRRAESPPYHSTKVHPVYGDTGTVEKASTVDVENAFTPGARFGAFRPRKWTLVTLLALLVILVILLASILPFALKAKHPDRVRCSWGAAYRGCH